jgi:hypothetical protein
MRTIECITPHSFFQFRLHVSLRPLSQQSMTFVQFSRAAVRDRFETGKPSPLSAVIGRMGDRYRSADTMHGLAAVRTLSKYKLPREALS